MAAPGRPAVTLAEERRWLVLRRVVLAVTPEGPAEKEKTKPAPARRPVFLSPPIAPNLKSATLYPAERQVGFRIHERKKDKGPVSSDA
jgi:hypothetical protein